jgi:hypothetical protein
MVQPLADNRRGFFRFVPSGKKPELKKPALGEKPAAETAPIKETETFKKRDFPAKGCLPYSPRWLFGGKIKQLGVQASKTEIIYAETRL